MNKKILVCDDDEGIVDLLESILVYEGYETFTELNSLNIFNRISEISPDLLLLDLWMPVLSGDQIVKNLRNKSETLKLPIIIISASRDGSDVAEDVGADDYIAKPFDIDQLTAKVNLILRSSN